MIGDILKWLDVSILLEQIELWVDYVENLAEGVEV